MPHSYKELGGPRPQEGGVIVMGAGTLEGPVHGLVIYCLYSPSPPIVIALASNFIHSRSL